MLDKVCKEGVEWLFFYKKLLFFPKSGKFVMNHDVLRVGKTVSMALTFHRNFLTFFFIVGILLKPTVMTEILFQYDIYALMFGLQ